MYNSYLDSFPSARSEDLVLQVTRVGSSVQDTNKDFIQGEGMRLLAWQRLRSVQSRLNATSREWNLTKERLDPQIDTQGDMESEIEDD